MGNGLTDGAQDTLAYLSEPHTDSVFAVEGFGWFELSVLLLGVVVIVVVIRAWQLRRKRRLANDPAHD